VADPLYDAFFTPTAPPRVATPVLPREPDRTSAAPVRTPGTRSRAGNAMNRTRAALLDGARRAVRTHGTKITMAQVAASAGVAKATLYNHFRTREALLDALLADEVEALVSRFGALPLADALSGAASEVAEHPLLRALAQLEPATLARLGCIDLSANPWRRASEAVDAVLSADRRAGGELVLRWLASYLLSPATQASIAADLAILVAGLPDAPVEEHAAPEHVEARTA
jgi:AcrR family transcriptional regulator